MTATNKVAFHMTAWPDMRAVCQEYAIDIYALAEAIEQRSIQTRGIVYDDIHQTYHESNAGRADGFTDIAPEKWAEFIFEEEAYELKDGEKRCRTLLYGFQRLPFMGVPDAQEIKSGYADIQVNRADFESKIAIKTLPKGKRKHAQIAQIRLIYDRLKKLRGTDTLKPDEVLQYVIDNYSSGTHDFEIVEIDEHPADKRKSVLHLEVAGAGDGEREMTVGRFYNIISGFNNPKILP